MFVEKRLIKKEQDERARLMLIQEHVEPVVKKLRKEPRLSISDAVKKG